MHTRIYKTNHQSLSRILGFSWVSTKGWANLVFKWNKKPTFVKWSLNWISKAMRVFGAHGAMHCPSQVLLARKWISMQRTWRTMHLSWQNCWKPVGKNIEQKKQPCGAPWFNKWLVLVNNTWILWATNTLHFSLLRSYPGVLEIKLGLKKMGKLLVKGLELSATCWIGIKRHESCQEEQNVLSLYTIVQTCKFFCEDSNSTWTQFVCVTAFHCSVHLAGHPPEFTAPSLSSANHAFKNIFSIFPRFKLYQPEIHPRRQRS